MNEDQLEAGRAVIAAEIPPGHRAILVLVDVACTGHTHRVPRLGVVTLACQHPLCDGGQHQYVLTALADEIDGDPDVYWLGMVRACLRGLLGLVRADHRAAGAALN